MANEIQTQYSSGMTLYAVVLNSSFAAWNGSAFETINSAHWTTYAIALSESSGTGLYNGSFPSGIGAGTYSLMLRQRAGSSPAASDPEIGSASIVWNGSAEVSPISLSTASGTIPVNHNTGGVDNLRYIDASGNGIGEAAILIYLATDWPANPGHVQAMSTTGPDGRWLFPAFIAGGTYVAVFDKIGCDGPDVSGPFTV